MSGESKREAREFLTSLVIHLQALNATNQQLIQVNAQRVQQEQTFLQYCGYLSQQLDGLAQRLDGLDRNLANFSRILAEGDLQLPLAQFPLSDVAPRRPRPFQVPTAGQMLGGFVGYGVDHLFADDGFPGGGGRGRNR